MAYSAHYDFRQPLDDMWEVLPNDTWSFETLEGQARFENGADKEANIYLRPCSSYGDTIEVRFSEESRQGTFQMGLLAGFEMITFKLNVDNGESELETHEYHKMQPRARAQIPTDVSTLTLTREQDRLIGLPYEGSKVTIYADGKHVMTVGNIDFLPESHVMFGLIGKGKVGLASLAIRGPDRPRPEYTHVGVWQQGYKDSIPDYVDALIDGVKQAADANVEILLTPETSLTGLPHVAPPISERPNIQDQLGCFQRAVAKIANAPFTLIGYPEWIDASQVEAAEIDRVPVNCHRFVRPDGTLGPPMAKVHSCEKGLWHGRNYNLQRVCGVEVALGVCHDGHYQDVWATGVMGGARLCLHPLCGGRLQGHIPQILSTYEHLGTHLDCYWARTNAGGGSAIVYPCKNAKVRDTILAVPDDLSRQSPTYPDYSFGGDCLIHHRIRLWDATGCYPMRTLRSGSNYSIWQQLIPEIIDV